MKVRILGCGTSSGVPRIGNDWGSCNPADPRNRRLRSAILIDSGGESLLVDCGPDLLAQMNAADRDRVDRVIITHDHADHCHGIDDLRQVAHVTHRTVPLHARADVLARLESRFAYVFNGSAAYPGVLTGHAIDREMRVGEARLRFVDQPHGGISSLGIRAEHHGKSLVYAIDYHDLTPDMAAMYEGADVWVSDCLRRRPHPTHAHLDAVLGWARDCKVGQLYLTHMGNGLDYGTLVRELPDWAAPAHDGLEIGL